MYNGSRPGRRTEKISVGDGPGVENDADRFGDIQWRYQEMDRSKYDTTVLMDGRSDMRSGFVADELFRDMYAMAQCDMLVGQFTSNIDRIVLEMMVARRAAYVPFISLDTPWCSQGDKFMYRGTSYTC